MKNNLLFTLLFAVISSSFFAKASINITSYILLGDIEDISQKEQSKIISLLAPFQGESKSDNDIFNATKVLEKALNDRKNTYNVSMWYKKHSTGEVFLKISSSKKLIYRGTQGFSDENIKKSLPSLDLDKFYDDGRQWIDLRELTMAQENPLKVTLLNYDLSPENQSSVLTVYSHAPYGNKYTYLTVDSYGSRDLNYARFNIGHINANLTGNDDILSLSGLTNFKRPEDYYALSLNYLYPFYKQHQTLGLNISYSHTNSDESTGLANGLDRKIARGNIWTSALNWNYYLPQLDWWVKDQFKLTAGYIYRHYGQSTSLQARQQALSNDLKFSLGGFNIGFSGEIKPTVNSEIKFNISQAYYSHKLPGSRNISRLTESGYDRSYSLTSYNLSYSQNIANWNLKTELSGQYTKNKIPSIEYQSVTGIYNVRGFKYTNLSADKGIVWKTELTTPAYTSFNFKNYIFYDWGKFRYNDSNRSGDVLSSMGLGFKGEIIKGLNFDIFVARRLHNSKLDRLDNGVYSDKTTVWGKLSYGF